MYIDLVDRLRCPYVHAESWLVLAADRIIERTVLEGTLGCPTCRAEFAIESGVVRFNAAPLPDREAFADPEQAVRIAAFLQLTDPAGLALLEGQWGAQAPAVAALSPVQLVVLSPDARVDAQPGVSPILADGCPVSANALVGAALDRAATADAIVAAVRPSGRVMGPVSLAVPAGVREVARDAQVWVGERIATSPIVPIGIRRHSAPGTAST